MAKKKTSTLDKVGDAAKKAAKTVKEKVVEPASDALGLTGGKKKATKSSTAKKAGSSKTAETGEAKKSSTAKSGAAKKSTTAKTGAKKKSSK